MKHLVSFLFVLLFSVASYAQVTVKGKVTSPDEEPLIGVNIVLKNNKTVGAVSDINGEFSISLPKQGGVLVFSYIGMKTEEVSVGKKTKLNVVMDYDDRMLDEVVISVGYGQMKKRDLTGSVSTVSGETLSSTGLGTIEQGLQGRMSGVAINATDNAPGAGLDIIVRGTGSINASSAPLYVIDGFPIDGDYSKGNGNEMSGSSPLMSLDPNNIESIDILKDASATAIYGARGANGVVIITTKSGKEDSVDVSLSANYGFMKMNSQKYKALDTYGYAEYNRNRSYPYAARQKEPDPESDGYKWWNLEKFKDETSTDWLDEVSRIGQSQNYNLTVSGGHAKSKIGKYNFMASLGYYKNDGIIKNTDYERFTGNFKLNAQPNKWLEVSLNANLSSSENNGTVTVNSSASANYAGIIQQALRADPMKSPDDDYVDTEDSGDGVTGNPLATLKYVDMVNEDQSMILNGSISILPLDGLRIKFLGGMTKRTGNAKSFFPSNTSWGKLPHGRGKVNYRATTSYLSENTITYNKSFGGHKLNVLGGFTAQAQNQFFTDIESSNFPVESMGFDNMGVGTIYKAPNTKHYDYLLLSYLGRLNYGYKDRYLVTASFRADGSSKFAKNNKWGYFPSFSFAWRANQEKFLKNVSWIDNLKLRAGWGQTGNPNIGSYKSFVNYSMTKYPSGNDLNIGFYPSNIANNDLKWETAVQTNVGIDFAVLRNRLSLTVDAYIKRTKDLLVNSDVAPSLGYGSYLTNLGEIENKGIEISLNSVIIDKTFKWTNTLNITTNRNKVLALGNGITQMDVPGTDEQSKAILKVGEPIGLWYGYQTDGLFQQDEFTWNPKTNKYVLNEGVPAISKDVKPGQWKFKDISGPDGKPDGIINDYDKTIIGRSLPKFEGGMVNNFSYKNFDLSLLLEWSYGREVYNANNRFLIERVNQNSNGFDVDYWKPIVYALDENGNELRDQIVDPGNPDGKFPGAGCGDAYGPMHDAYIEDGSYLRIKNITFGYNFSPTKIRKLGMKSLRLYVSANNIYTFTGYSGFDPNVNGRDLGGMRPGYDLSSYPLSFSMLFGVNVKF